MAGFEKIINMAITGSSKMGGREGILQQFSSLVADYSEGIKEEMTEMFNKVFKRQEEEESKEDEPVKIDEKQYEELQKNAFEKIMQSRVVQNLRTQRQEQLKKFLKSDVVKSFVNNKMFKKLITGVQGIVSSVKTGIGNLIGKILPPLMEMKNTVTTYVNTAYTFMRNVGVFMIKMGKTLATIAARTAMIATRLLLVHIYHY